MSKIIMLIGPADPAQLTNVFPSTDHEISRELTTITLAAGELPNEALKRVYGDAAPSGASIYQFKRIGTVKPANKVGGGK